MKLNKKKRLIEKKRKEKTKQSTIPMNSVLWEGVQ
jgi:hypothetical protein